jgi:hypothetical protein
MPTVEPDPYKDPADFFEAIDDAATVAEKRSICDEYRTSGERWRSISDHIGELNH